jgi:hypothetical protein
VIHPGNSSGLACQAFASHKFSSPLRHRFRTCWIRRFSAFSPLASRCCCLAGM